MATAAEEQVKQIIILMSPENSSQTDAVFLVQRFVEATNTKLRDKDKQIALLEAEKEKLAKEKQDVINEKLQSEARLMKEKEDLIKSGDAIPAKIANQPKVGMGRTL